MRSECEKLVLKVGTGEINYIRTTLESYDGMALVRTIDPKKALIEVYIAPGCQELVISLLESLRAEGLSIFFTNAAKY
ncbi:MAG: DUF4911 domain-containing protein [Deltaproteobacteria bacterium]|nr:MAG: DUF4911 domain-containing protein [Deltaproteobacteria bacterium]HDG96913.1 DUF4911 domain-containing protein [Desulfobacterales bacterium]